MILNRHQSTHTYYYTRCLFIIQLLTTISTSQTLLPITNDLPTATVGIPYIQTFSLQTTALSINTLGVVNISNLPAGFSIQGYQLFGIPLTAGIFSIQLAVTRNNLVINSTRKNYTLNINGITTSSILPFTYVNVPFSVNVSYIGGLPPFGWMITNNPPWLSINNSFIFGTPNKTGNITFQTTLTDSQGNTLIKDWLLITQPNKLVLSPLRIDE